MTPAAAELESTELLLCFAENAVSLMRDQVQKNTKQLCKVEGARVPAGEARADAEYNVHSLTVSEPALSSEVAQIARLVRRLQMKSLECIRKAIGRWRKSFSSVMP